MCSQEFGGHYSQTRPWDEKKKAKGLEKNVTADWPTAQNCSLWKKKKNCILEMDTQIQAAHSTLH